LVKLTSSVWKTVCTFNTLLFLFLFLFYLFLFFHLFFIFSYFSLHLISTARTTFTFTGLCPMAHGRPPKEPEHGRLAGGGQGRATGEGARVARPRAPSSSPLSWSCGPCSFSPPSGSFRTYDEKNNGCV
jgi:hypothetical protein